MTTTLQVRMDKQIKDRAQKAFIAMGLDLSSGVKLFLTQVANTQSIPFEIFSANNLSRKEKLEMIKEANDALKYGKRYRNAEEMHRDILK